MILWNFIFFLSLFFEKIMWTLDVRIFSGLLELKKNLSLNFASKQFGKNLFPYFIINNFSILWKNKSKEMKSLSKKWDFTLKQLLNENFKIMLSYMNICWTERKFLRKLKKNSIKWIKDTFFRGKSHKLHLFLKNLTYG